MQFALKVILSALVIAGASELGKRSTFAAAILISLPLTSILALAWLHSETGDTAQVSALSMSIFWLVVPSLVFFVLLSRLLDHGLAFWPSLGIACIGTAAAYAAYAFVLAKLGFTL